MKQENRLDKSLRKGVGFLNKNQETNGGFLCLASKNLKDYSRAQLSPAIVPANIVLSSLARLEETETIKKIRKKTANFLLSQKGEYWSFNYWIKSSKEYKQIPYPDDLDDTFCALAALYEYDPKLFTGGVMAKIAVMLTSAEEREGGPYDMWLVPSGSRKDWHRIDLVVNSNIAYFLFLQDIFLPKVNNFIEQEIEKGNYSFPYCSEYPAIYFISRFYRGKKTKRIVNFLLGRQNKNGGWGNPLHTALAVSAILNFHSSTENKIPKNKLGKGIDCLVRHQSKTNGGWRPYSFYVELKKRKNTLYAGSASITTALCLEAINKFKKYSTNPVLPATAKNKKNNGKKMDMADKIHKEISRRGRKKFGDLNGDIKKIGLKMIEKIAKGDSGKKITLLPYLFFSSLKPSKTRWKDDKQETDLMTKLGLANLYGWTAYTIYDNFLDDEGEPPALSVANICLREMTFILKNSVSNKSFGDFFDRIMDNIDSANTWETIHCRAEIKNKILNTPGKIPDYKNYEKLAERSLGHALGPIALLFTLKRDPDSQEIENTLNFFKYYIIARQLNDDAHDWMDDLEKGQISPVNARILAALNKKQVNIDQEKEDIQKLFWEKISSDIFGDILENIRLARKSIKKVSAIKNFSFFDTLLSPIEMSVQKAMSEKKDTLEFLKAYLPDPTRAE